MIVERNLSTLQSINWYEHPAKELGRYVVRKRSPRKDAGLLFIGSCFEPV